MSVRFYLLNEAAPYTPPSWDGGWDITNGSGVKAFDPHKFGGAIGSPTSVADTVTTSPYHIGVLQLVSRRLKPGQTISGTVDLIVSVFGSGGDAEFFTRVHLYVIDTSDDSIVGTLLNEYQESSGGGATEWPQFNTGIALQSAQALSSVAIPNDSGDYRLVAELGCNAENTHSTSRLAGMRYGARTSNFAPLNDLTVGGSTSTLAGFLEFSDDIELADDVVPNVTVETAIAITPDAPATQELYDAGVTYEAWYKYTAPAGVKFVSVWGFGDLAAYKPFVRIYRAGGVAHVDEIGDERRNKPLEFVTVPGTTYYLLFSHYIEFSPYNGNPDPSTLSVTLELAPTGVAPAGSLLVIDDTPGYPAVLLSAEDGDVIRFVSPFAASEAGSMLPNGISCFVDLDPASSEIATVSSVKLYDASLNLTVTLPLNVTAQGPMTSNNLDTFYVSNADDENGDIDLGSIHKVTSSGVYLGKIASVTGVSSPRALLGMAVSLDESILYYSRYHIQDGMEVGAIFRWDLTTDTTMPTFVASISNYHICREILCLADGTILASYNHFNSVGSFVQRYDTSGSVLNTYTLEASIRVSDEIRLAHDPDNPLSFWVWTKTGTGTSMSKFRHILVDDGSDLVTPIEVPFFNTGLYGPPETATPEMFGHSFSCPFVVMRSETTGGGGDPVGVIGPLVWVHIPRRT